jgi:flavin reductase (DIM6/NTAB) family NADH-FMN oxidoreductase RutF
VAKGRGEQNDAGFFSGCLRSTHGEAPVNIDPRTLNPADGYKLLTNLVVPRPIAWVTSQNANGTINLAPFSFFNAVGSNPLFVVVSIGDETPGQPKHTAKNIADKREFVVNLVTEDLINAMNISAADFPEGESELTAAGLHPADSVHVRVPRVAQAQAALECKLHDQIRLGVNTLIIGQVVGFYVVDPLIDEQLHIHGFAPIGRLGSPSMYCRTTDRFDLPRLSHAQWSARQATVLRSSTASHKA